MAVTSSGRRSLCGLSVGAQARWTQLRQVPLDEQQQTGVGEGRRVARDGVHTDSLCVGRVQQSAERRQSAARVAEQFTRNEELCLVSGRWCYYCEWRLRDVQTASSNSEVAEL